MSTKRTRTRPALFMAFAACALLATLWRAACAQETVQVPLADRVPDGRRIGYWLPVKVAGGEPVLLLLDTGSKGLMIMSERLGKQGITKTGRRVRQGFLDGTVFEGEVVKAPVSFGPVASAGQVFILAVDRATCSKEKPDCPAKTFKTGSFGGIMGVGLGDISTLDNPLADLPSPLSNGFIIRGGAGGRPSTLTLGLTQENRQGFTMFPMPRMAVTLNWRDAFFKYNAISACIALQNSGQDRQCCKILFDSGSSMNLLQAKSLPAPGLILPNGVLRPGARIDIQAQGLAPIVATAETAPWSGLTRVVQGDDTKCILGAGYFQILDFLYDIKNNAIGIRPAR
jgi:hypothetical protein